MPFTCVRLCVRAYNKQFRNAESAHVIRSHVSAVYARALFVVFPGVDVRFLGTDTARHRPHVPISFLFSGILLANAIPPLPFGFTADNGFPVTRTCHSLSILVVLLLFFFFFNSYYVTARRLTILLPCSVAYRYSKAATGRLSAWTSDIAR